MDVNAKSYLEKVSKKSRPRRAERTQSTGDASEEDNGRERRGSTRKRFSDVTGNLEHRPRTTSRSVYLYARGRERERDGEKQFFLTRAHERASNIARAAKFAREVYPQTTIVLLLVSA